jgi:hypothetical protein
MRNVISLSIYGKEPVYLSGALANVELAPVIYPGWEVIVWADRDVPRKTLNALRDSCDLKMPLERVTMFTRFLVNDIPDVDRYIVRDADSRLNEREAKAVQEWIDSGKGAHVIRDHPGHKHPMMGGMWGAVKGAVPSMLALMKDVNVESREYMDDQKFLWEKVWPEIRGDCLQHDFCGQWTGARPFPSKMGDYRFVGERFSQDDEPNGYDWQKRLPYMTP